MEQVYIMQYGNSDMEQETFNGAYADYSRAFAGAHAELEKLFDPELDVYARRDGFDIVVKKTDDETVIAIRSEGNFSNLDWYRITKVNVVK